MDERCCVLVGPVSTTMTKYKYALFHGASNFVTCCLARLVWGTDSMARTWWSLEAWSIHRSSAAGIGETPQVHLVLSLLSRLQNGRRYVLPWAHGHEGGTKSQGSDKSRETNASRPGHYRKVKLWKEKTWTAKVDWREHWNMHSLSENFWSGGGLWSEEEQ